MIKYPPELNNEIERAFNVAPSYTYKKGGKVYKLDFGTFLQICLNDNKRQILQRSSPDPRNNNIIEEIKNLSSLTISELTENLLKCFEWDYVHDELPMDPPVVECCKKDLLMEISDEYKLVKALFDVSMKDQYTHLKIEKLFNPRTKYFYIRKLRQMLHENDQTIYSCVRILFHGTSMTEPEHIYNGYDESFAPRYSKNAGRWGIGIYFSNRAAYSNNGFSYVKDGYKSLFLASVSIGKYSDFGENDNSELLAPPVLFEGTSKRFDSVKAAIFMNDIHIIYDANMAYPEYLITYKESIIFIVLY